MTATTTTITPKPKPYLQSRKDDLELYLGDSYEIMTGLPDKIADVVVTSPPYYPVQRDFKLGPEQLGWESHPQEYINKLVHRYFAEARRLLKDTGSLFVVIGDCYNGEKSGNTNGIASQGSTIGSTKKGFTKSQQGLAKKKVEGIHEKSLLAVPALLQVEMIYNTQPNWNMRNLQLWIKPNCIPKTGVGSMKDPKTGKKVRRPADRWGVDYELIPFFPKDPDSYYFVEQKEPYETDDISHKMAGFGGPNKHDLYGNKTYSGTRWLPNKEKMKIARSILWINTSSEEGAEHSHPAPFPVGLVDAILDAACPPGGTVMDIFAGSCSACVAALKSGRRFVGIELNKNYLDEAIKNRLDKYINQERLF